MKKDAPFNPHCNEPVESGKFCWRINDGRAWKKETHDTENEALNTAKTYCIDNIGVGEYTIHIGITKTEPVETQQLIDRNHRMAKFMEVMIEAKGVEQSIES